MGAPSIMKRILFLFGNQACVPEDPLHAARSLGCGTIVMASRVPCGVPPGVIDHFEKVLLRDAETVIESARTLQKILPFDGVVGYDDQAVPFVARVAAALKLPGHPVEAADAARDKIVMKQRFNGKATPIIKKMLPMNM